MKSPLAVNRTPYVTPRAIGGAKPITVLSTSTTSSSSRRPPHTRSNSEVTISTRQSTGSRSGRSGAVKNSYEPSTAGASSRTWIVVPSASLARRSYHFVDVEPSTNLSASTSIFPR